MHYWPDAGRTKHEIQRVIDKHCHKAKPPLGACGDSGGSQTPLSHALGGVFIWKRIGGYVLRPRRALLAYYFDYVYFYDLRANEITRREGGINSVS